MKLLAAALSFSVALFCARAAEATLCSRWANDLTPCDGIVAQPDCEIPVDDLPCGQRRSYYNWVYSKNPQKACRKRVMKIDPGEEDDAQVIQINHVHWLCFWDWDEDGNTLADASGEDDDGDTIDDDDWNSISHITLDNQIEREPECDLVPQGPYTNDNPMFPRPPVRPVPGGKFIETLQKKQRRWITDENDRKHGGSLSDASSSATPNTGIGDNAATWVTRQVFPHYEDDPEFQEDLEWAAPTAPMQIDHIIPRIDIHGCACGTNGYNNAAVITGPLNNKMSNNMRDPDRIKMLQAFVPGYVPPSPRLVSQSSPAHADVSPTAGASPHATSDIGGCSTAPGSSAAGGLALVCIALLRVSRLRSRVRSATRQTRF